MAAVTSVFFLVKFYYHFFYEMKLHLIPLSVYCFLNYHLQYTVTEKRADKFLPRIQIDRSSGMFSPKIINLGKSFQ